MARPFGFVAVLIATTAVAGCDGGESTGRSRSVDGAEPTTRNDGLQSAPENVVRRCSPLVTDRDVPVMCPTRLPEGQWVVRHPSLRPGPYEYLLDLETEPLGSGDMFHVLAGGRSGRFPLSTTPSGDWPRDTRLRHDLGLVGAKPLRPGQRATDFERVRLRRVGRASVAGREALLLRVREYPEGGVHGGHLAVVWNIDGAGYAVTAHFSQDARLDERGRQSMLLAVAAGMRMPRSADGG